MSGRLVGSEALRRLGRNRLAVVSAAVVAVYVLVALLVAFGVVAQGYDRETGDSYEPPSWRHWLGTDIFGRDVLTRVVHGTKISLSVGFLASTISMVIGVLLGASAGFLGGWWDDLVVWLYSTLASVPGLLLVLALNLVLKDRTVLGLRLSGLATVYLAIGLVSWVGLCRVVRAEVMKHRDREYVLAAAAFGAGPFRRIFRHILPNISHLVIVDFSLRFVGAIQSEVIVSFLGLGAVDVPSWGVMIGDARLSLSRGVWWEFAGASAAMFVLVLALNILGDGLRDALDPRMRGRL